MTTTAIRLAVVSGIALALSGLACVHVPNLEKGAAEISVSNEPAPSDHGELAKIQVTHGLGRSHGSREGAMALLRNAAVELGAVRVHITTESHGSSAHSYHIEALAVMPAPLTNEDFSSDLLNCTQDEFGRRCISTAHRMQ